MRRFHSIRAVLIPVMVLTVHVITPRTAHSETPLQVCDRLAANDEDDTRPASVPGMWEYSVVPDEAMAPCLKAYELSGRSARYALQLGIVMEASGQKEKAIALYREAAEAGNAVAMVGLADEIQEKQPLEAFGWYRKAAETGNVAGLYSLGVAYQYGTGTKVDIARALEYYEKALVKGSSRAPFDIGRIYLTGDYLPRDATRAIRHYEIAVERGNSNGMYGLGQIYEEGLGVPVDLTKAIYYYRLAGAQDDDEAEAMAQELEERQAEHPGKQ